MLKFLVRLDPPQRDTPPPAARVPSRKETDAPPAAIEPQSKRLREKHAKRVADERFGQDEAWGDESQQVTDDAGFVVSDEDDAASESAEGSSEGDAEASEQDEGSEEGGEEEGEEGEAGAEDMASAEEEPPARNASAGIRRITSDRVVDGVVFYRCAWHGSDERTWEASSAAVLQGDVGVVELAAFEERKERRAAKAQADLEEAIAAGWAVAGRRRDGGDEEEAADEDEVREAPTKRSAEEVAEAAAEGEPRGVASEVGNEGAGVPANDDADADAVWVCCDQCEKWRRLPAGTPPPDVDAAWTCSMNPDTSRADCDAEAEEMPEEEEDEAAAEEEEPLEVDRLVARRETADGGEEYRVRWKGRDWEADTWVAREAVAAVQITRFNVRAMRSLPGWLSDRRPPAISPLRGKPA